MVQRTAVIQMTMDCEVAGQLPRMLTRFQLSQIALVKIQKELCTLCHASYVIL